MRIFSLPAVIPINSIPINEKIAIWNDMKKLCAPLGEKAPSFPYIRYRCRAIACLHSKYNHNNTNGYQSKIVKTLIIDNQNSNSPNNLALNRF